MNNIDWNVKEIYMHTPHHPQKLPYNIQRYVTYITFSILELIFCSKICGILGLVFINQANTAYRYGEEYEAVNKKQYAKIALIVGIVVPVILIVIAFVVLSILSSAARIPVYV